MKNVPPNIKKKDTEVVIKQPVSFEKHEENKKNISKEEFKKSMLSIKGLEEEEEKTINRMADDIFDEK